MRVLLTGGSGFLGRQILQILENGGDEVVIFDLSEPGPAIAKERGASYFRGDITSFDDVSECISKNRVDGIIHAAAKLLGDQEDPLGTFRVNVLGLGNVLEAARKAQVSRMVSISTAGVYGKRPDLNPLPEDLPMTPEDTYEHTKALGEGLARLYVDRYGLDVRVIRLPFLYGPRQHLVWPLNIVLYHAIKGKPLTLKQGGDYSLEYLHVQDAAAGAVAALRSDNATSRLYNIGTGRCVPVRDILRTAKRIFPGFDYNVGVGPWSSEALNAWVRGPLDVTRAKEELGFVARYDLERGMRDLASWEQVHLDELERWPDSELWILG